MEQTWIGENAFSPSYRSEFLTLKTRSSEEETVKFSAYFWGEEQVGKNGLKHS